jgi:hypothetical protein
MLGIDAFPGKVLNYLLRSLIFSQTTCIGTTEPEPSSGDQRRPREATEASYAACDPELLIDFGKRGNIKNIIHCDTTQAEYIEQSWSR